MQAPKTTSTVIAGTMDLLVTIVTHPPKIPRSRLLLPLSPETIQVTKPKSNDPLNALLREAMFQQRAKVQVKTVVLPTTKSSDEALDLYRNPLNWTQARIVSLIHRSPEGREVFLGVFTELVNNRAKARRLIPSHVTPTSTLPRETVTGDYWLHPQVYQPPADSPREIAAIRARCRELLG